MVNNWLIDNDKETDNILVIQKQSNEKLKFCLYDIRETTQKTISDLLENFVFSAVD